MIAYYNISLRNKVNAINILIKYLYNNLCTLYKQESNMDQESSS